MHHALALGRLLGDTEAAERLTKLAAETTARQGEILTVRGWLEALPDDRVRGDAELAILRGWILAMTGDLARADDYTQTAESILNAPGAAAVKDTQDYRQRLGKLRAVRSFIVLLKDQDAGEQVYRSVLMLAETALELLPEHQPHWGVLALWSKAEALERMNRVPESIKTLTEAIRLGRTMQGTLFAIVAEGGLVKLLNDCGRRRDAMAVCEDALQHYADGNGNPLPLASLMFSQLGSLYYEANDLAKAKACHARALALGEQLGLAYQLVYSRALAAPTWYALGQTDRALSALREGYQHATQRGYADADWFLSWEANIRLWQGDFVFARHWARSTGLSPRDEMRLLRIEQHVTYGRVLIAQRRLSDAHHWLSNLAVFTSKHGLIRWHITAQLLQAVIVDRMGGRESALDLIAQAILAAAPEGYVRGFLVEGPRVIALLPELRNAAPAFVDRLLGEAAAMETAQGAPSPGTSLLTVDPLTDRELEVLRLVASGHSNQKIAERLVIAVGTVKRHINNIYGKLQAHRRTEAVARARDLGIL